MKRLLATLVFVTLVAVAVAWLANRQGHLVYELDGWRISMSAGLAIAAAIAFAILSVIVARLFGVIVSGPGAIADWWRLRRQQRGQDALSKGLVAAAAGDVADVRRHAKKIGRTLGHSPLGLLLTAQAAALDGDRDGQRAAYRAMLEHPEMEFLGLRGLYLDAMARDDIDGATEMAGRAHALRPRAPWAANALFDLKCSRGEWGDARAVLDNAAKAGIVTQQIAKRRRAVLLAAEAGEADAHDPDRALALALAALELKPGLVPAAVIAAHRLSAQDKIWRAQDVIETAWPQSPHPDLAAAYAAIRPSEALPERSERLIALARLAHDHFEGRVLEAGQHMAMNRWAEARRVLAPLARGFAGTRVCTMMAEIEQAQYGDSAAAHAWLERAAQAPRDAEWRCTGCGWSSPRWQAVCGHCRSFDSLSWTAPQTLPIETPVPAAMAPESTPVEAAAPRHRPDDPGPGGEDFAPTGERPPGFSASSPRS